MDAIDKNIIELRLKGLSYKKIAKELKIAKSTVENRLKNLYENASREIQEKLDGVNKRNRTTKENPVTDIDILKLRLKNKLTYEQIGIELGYSRVSINKRLKRIYNKSNCCLKKQLDEVKHEIDLKEKIDLSMVTPYQLGIIWAIGRYNEEGAMFFRHKERYFLEILQSLCESQISESKSRTGVQYRLKSVLFDSKQLNEWGWTERNAAERNLPALDDYRDFLRAYLEIHSSIDYATRQTRKNEGSNITFKYYVPRLRIYGNISLIESINLILYHETGVGLKTPQIVHNGKTAYIAYSTLSEIKAISTYVHGEPCCKKFWNEFEEKIKHEF